MDMKMPDSGRIVSKGRDIFDEVIKRGKQMLPHVARICLVGTYIDDGLRMWLDWAPQTNYMSQTWNCGEVIATLFVIVNFVGQLTGATMVVTRRFATAACGTLFGITILQIFAYSTMWDSRFIMRNLAVIGGVVLLLADSRAEGRSLFAGLPSTGEDKSRKPYVLLSGRILLVLMFLTLLDLQTDVVSIIMDVVGLALVLSIAFGFKTKAASLILATWLSVLNLYENSWWMVSSNQPHQRDYLKYDFFQTLSVIGGLLLVASLGPGGISVDTKLKQW